ATMYWCRYFIIILCAIAASQDCSAQACDDDCKAVLVQEFRNIVKQELDPLYQFLNEKLKPLDDMQREMGTLRREIKNKMSLLAQNISDVKEPVMEIHSQVSDLAQNISDMMDPVMEIHSQVSVLAQNISDLKDPFMKIHSQVSPLMQNISDEKNATTTGCLGVDGFFRMSTQYFKIFKDRQRPWEDAKSHCEARGMILAEPSDSVAVDLRKYLVENYG
ncbi:unnamed protein product, partial [Meganyctiphanes norvegica]